MFIDDLGLHYSFCVILGRAKNSEICKILPIIANYLKTMKPIPNGVEYVYPPILYSDRRKSICKIPSDYVQLALSESDFQDLSREFALETAVIKAIIKIESNGSGFLLQESPPARPKILFERHWFYKLTPHPVSHSRPDLSHPHWDKSQYQGGSGEWKRLLEAMEFDEIPALKSASFGLGQVMGFNYLNAGCTSIQQFVEENFAGEYWQARHMLNFIVNAGLSDQLKRKDWKGFARRYNGSGYQQNAYDRKLADAYRRAIAS